MTSDFPGMSRRQATALLLVAAALTCFVVGLVLAHDNPEVDVSASDLDDTGPAGRVECSIAPWDAGLNDNDNGPGGDHTDAFRGEVAADCYAASRRRFDAAVAVGVAGALLLVAAPVVGARRNRSDKSVTHRS